MITIDYLRRILYDIKTVEGEPVNVGLTWQAIKCLENMYPETRNRVHVSATCTRIGCKMPFAYSSPNS